MSNELVMQNQENLVSASNVWSDPVQYNQMMKSAQMLSQTSLIPQSYQKKPGDCFLAIEMASRMNVSPMMVMQNMYVVRGKPSWAGQACTTFIKASGQFKDVRHVYFGEKGTDGRGCYVTATRVSDGEQVDGASVTIKMAKDEHWYSKKDSYGNETSKWPTMPELMLAYRASAFFARVYCPETLMGVQTTEEVIDTANNQQAVATNNLTDALNGAKKKTKPKTETVQADIIVEEPATYFCEQCGEEFKTFEKDGKLYTAEAQYNFLKKQSADGIARCAKCRGK